jgi:HlyD family secretion protein
LILLAVLAAVAYGTRTLWHRPVVRPSAPAPRSRPTPEAVAALGRLDPAGDIIQLAAPTTSMGATPRITQLLVREGDRVRRGQLLARFDNAPNQLADLALLRARIQTLNRRLVVQGRDLARFRSLAGQGAIAANELDNREQAYLELQGQLLEARAEYVKSGTDVVNTELRAPMDGTVLRVHSREGERPLNQGILELGQIDQMEALLEIYESDISRVRVGQRAVITSENGGFSGSLAGVVQLIYPQVRQRQILATDPTGDADARIVEVRVRLNPEDARRVRSLAGLKVIGRLQP